ncbi:hypothetical protein V5N11_001878 [Cardamine amara subsp. amara]|uniref:Rho termination factor-like N-terminal domain-containing protein n=1 Tax=Cardamine amara subsp. amara TaxID=228776 RepID=A0ABD1B4I1_CARAN
MRLTVDDDDLWGPPLVVEDDTFRKQTMRGCEFWFDCRTDVLEENFQNEKYCELVWRILSEKKQDVEIDEVDKVSVSIQNDMVSSGSGGSDDVDSSDSDKTLSASLPDADTSSAKSALDEDENTSSISDAQTIETSDSSNETEEIELETRLKPQETAANGPLTVEVSEDADTSSCPVLGSKVEEAEEHSCSSLVTDQVLDPIKQAPGKKSSSAISRENTGGSTLRPLLLEIREKVREEANASISGENTGGSTLRPLLLKIREKVREKANAATNKDGEIVKDHQQNDGLQDIVTVSEPFTTESLLDLCDEPDKDRETPCDERSEKTHLEAVKTVVKDELIINLLTEARVKAESKALLNPGTALIKKRQRDNKGMNTNFIRNTKKKVQGEAGEIIRGSSVPPQHADSLLDSIDGIGQGGGRIVSDSVISISTSELKNKTGKELRSLAKELKVTHYYKLKKEDLLQRLTNHINQLTECTKQRMESEPISLV